MFDANAIKYAVLGHPIGHSRSPEIQNLLFEMTDYNGVYMAFDMPPEKLDDALPFFKEYFKGFNCTIPLKEKIIPYLDLLDARAKWCGSVNTVKVRDGKLYGYSTDGIGLTGALEMADIPLDGGDVLICGAGGVARVALFEALSRGCRVTIAARRLEQAELLRRDAADGFPGSTVSCCTLSEIKGSFSLLLQCTPVGMTPKAGEMPVSKDVVSQCAAIFDTIYSPKETLLVQTAKTLGKKAAGGLDMLILQAVAAQEVWRETKFEKSLIKSLLDGVKL